MARHMVNGKKHHCDHTHIQKNVGWLGWAVVVGVFRVDVTPWNKLKKLSNRKTKKK